MDVATIFEVDDGLKYGTDVLRQDDVLKALLVARLPVKTSQVSNVSRFLDPLLYQPRDMNERIVDDQ